MRVPRNTIPGGIHPLEKPQRLPQLEIKYILSVESHPRKILESRIFNEEAIGGHDLINNEDGSQSLDIQHWHLMITQNCTSSAE